MVYQITFTNDESNEVEYTSNNPVDVLFYQTARYEGKFDKEKALEATELMQDIFSKHERFVSPVVLADHIINNYSTYMSMSFEEQQEYFIYEGLK